MAFDDFVVKHQKRWEDQSEHRNRDIHRLDKTFSPDRSSCRWSVQDRTVFRFPTPDNLKPRRCTKNSGYRTLFAKFFHLVYNAGFVDIYFKQYSAHFVEIFRHLRVPRFHHLSIIINVCCFICSLRKKNLLPSSQISLMKVFFLFKKERERNFTQYTPRRIDAYRAMSQTRTLGT